MLTLKRPLWSLKVTYSYLKISKSSFLRFIICLTPNLFQKLFKNINIMKTQIFHRSSKVTKIFLAHSFMDWFWLKTVWKLISWRKFFPFYIWLEMSLMLWRIFIWFYYFKTFCPNYNLDLRSYEQLLSLFNSVVTNKRISRLITFFYIRIIDY